MAQSSSGQNLIRRAGINMGTKSPVKFKLCAQQEVLIYFLGLINFWLINFLKFFGSISKCAENTTNLLCIKQVIITDVLIVKTRRQVVN